MGYLSVLRDVELPYPSLFHYYFHSIYKYILFHSAHITADMLLFTHVLLKYFSASYSQNISSLS